MKTFMLGIAVVAVLALGAGLGYLSGGDRSAKTAGLVALCRAHLTEQALTAPSLKWPGGELVEDAGEGAVHVSGTVEGQNGFGATIRDTYECFMSYTDHWNIEAG